MGGEIDFQRILSIVDPNASGYVQFDCFLDFIPANLQTLTPPSKLSTPSESSQQTNLTSCPRNSDGNCLQTRLSIVSRECSSTLAWILFRELLITCPSPPLCMENQTCSRIFRTFCCCFSHYLT